MRKLRHICDGSAKLSWKNNCISKRADSGMAQKYVPVVTKKLYSGGTAGESGRFSSWRGTQKESERSHGTPDTSPFRLLSQAIYCSGCYQGLIPDTKPHNRINKIMGLSQISYENSTSKKAHKSKGGANPSFLCANKAYFLLNQATSTSNKATPKRPVSSLLQSLRILYANASRKNCVTVFCFPRVRNLLNP